MGRTGSSAMAPVRKQDQLVREGTEQPAGWHPSGSRDGAQACNATTYCKFMFLTLRGSVPFVEQPRALICMCRDCVSMLEAVWQLHAVLQKQYSCRSWAEHPWKA